MNRCEFVLSVLYPSDWLKKPFRDFCKDSQVQVCSDVVLHDVVVTLCSNLTLRMQGVPKNGIPIFLFLQ